MVLSNLLEKAIQVGRLDLIGPDGRRQRFSGAGGPRVAVRLHDPSLPRRIYFNPDLAIGEAYMEGTLTIEEGTLSDLLELMAANMGSARRDPLYALRDRLARLTRRWQQFYPVRLSRRNVAHHYDLPDKLYDLFLDADRQYSCAYFPDGDEDLERAQMAKKRHLAAKLLLEPGQRVLDIGSGWGGLALYLARESGTEVTGLTLSRSQPEVSCRRAAEAGLEGRVRFHLRDYREQQGTFERIVSVGMFEHVGVNHYRRFFDTIGRLLTEDRVCVLHSIGRMYGPGSTSPWIRKYIFPGGYSPSLSETLRAWRQRFEANRERIAELLDERFCRMWEYYLVLSEAAFRHGDHYVFRIQLARRRDTVSLNRNYITRWEENHPLPLAHEPRRVA